MAIVVFDLSGVPKHRREGLVSAVQSAGRHVRGSYEAWIVRSRVDRGFCIRITGPGGFFRQAEIGFDVTDAEVGEQVRQALAAR